MKRVTGLSAALFFAGLSTHAQSARSPRCGVEIVEAALSAQNPQAAQRLASNRAAMIDAATTAQTAAAKTTANGPIPVVFHIVLTSAQMTAIGGQAGIADRVDSSIAVLNRDYNRGNGDSTRIPAVFKPLYGNADIQFGLARRDPSGNATPGYEILTTTLNGFGIGPSSGEAGSGFACSGAKYPSTGLAAWDQSKYLNIWVCNITPTASNILGVALGPGTINSFGLPVAEKGITLNYRAFGKRRAGNGSFVNGIDSGRTLTHEAGHFFELRHIWGDDNGACPNQSGYSDDGISDTPPQDAENYGCPTGVLPNCTNSAGGEMYMNYMDYCNDVCLVMFTTQQSTVMRNQVQSGGASFGLTQNPNLVVPLGINDLDGARYGLTMSPNPAHDHATLSFDGTQKLQSVMMMDATGRVVRTFAQPAAAGILSLDLTGLSTGLYTVRAQFEDGAAVRKLVIQ